MCRCAHPKYTITRLPTRDTVEWVLGVADVNRLMLKCKWNGKRNKIKIKIKSTFHCLIEIDIKQIDFHIKGGAEFNAIGSDLLWWQCVCSAVSKPAGAYFLVLYACVWRTNINSRIPRTETHTQNLWPIYCFLFGTRTNRHPKPYAYTNFRNGKQIKNE